MSFSLDTRRIMSIATEARIAIGNEHLNLMLETVREAIADAGD